MRNGLCVINSWVLALVVKSNTFFAHRHLHKCLDLLKIGYFPETGTNSGTTARFFYLSSKILIVYVHMCVQMLVGFFLFKLCFDGPCRFYLSKILKSLTLAQCNWPSKFSTLRRKCKTLVTRLKQPAGT